MIQEAVMEYLINENGLSIEIETKAKSISNDIVDKLVYYRKQLNMTQQNVADATGIKRANIARIESKKHAITLDSLVKYANCLNLDICLSLTERS